VAHWGRGKSVLNCQFPICCPGNPSALPALWSIQSNSISLKFAIIITYIN
jgi:hypothetical protein